MKYFLDTEFNSFRGDLISLALVREDNEELYFEMPFFQDPHPWVFQNVLPHLQKGAYRVSNKSSAAARLDAFLAGDSAPVFICDWPTDIQHLCDLLSPEGGIRVGAREMEFRIDPKASSELSACPHHALYDARAMKKAFEKK